MKTAAQVSVRGVLAVGSRRALSTLFLASIVCIQGTAQIRVGVWTDRPVYGVGDTIKVTVTAYNPSLIPAHLSFSTSAQANYFLDGYNFHAHSGEWPMLTDATVPPRGSISWGDLRYPISPNDSSLSVGTHTLVGEVLGYGRSDTLTIIVTNESITSVAEHGSTSELFMLDQNYPNPFNPSTTIKYTLPKASMVQLSVYDILGRKVSMLVNEQKNAGTHRVTFDGTGLPSGVYFYRLQAEAFTRTRSLHLIR